jgi:hypothetical protein
MWNNVVVVYLFVNCASKIGGRGVDTLMVGGKNGGSRQKGWCELVVVELVEV